MDTNFSLYLSNAETFLESVVFPELAKIPASERQFMAFFNAVRVGTAIGPMSGLSEAGMTRLQFIIAERVADFLKRLV